MKTKRITLTTVALTAAAVGVAFLGACTEENTPVSGPLPSRSSTSPVSGVTRFTQRSDPFGPSRRSIPAPPASSAILSQMTSSFRSPTCGMLQV